MSTNFTQESIASCVEELLYQQVGDDTELLPETDLLNDLGIDSLELVELGLKMERAFGTKLPIADLRTCVTIEEITQLVLQLVQRKAA